MILLMYHLYCWGAYFYVSWMPRYLEQGRGFSRTEMLWTTLPFIAGVFGNLFGGWLSDRLSRRYGLRIGRVSVGASGLALSAICMLGAALTANRLVALGCLTLGYGFMDCMLPVSWAVCLDVGRKYAGAISGAMNMAGQIGSFLTSTLFGYVVHYFEGDYNKPLIPMAGMLLASAVTYLFINPNRQVVPEHAAPTPQPVAT
jgi:predicted MFS family arabinose efflux permease